KLAGAGGKKDRPRWGHLSYIDHGSGGPKVKGTGVTAYRGTGTSRHIEGTAEVNGEGGFTYEVDVADNGEPGRNDTFSLKLSNGYTASGNLAAAISRDRKSTRLNSSHGSISYAVFCLKKKKKHKNTTPITAIICDL